MKKNILLLLATSLTVGACGTSAGLASLSYRYEDGIYAVSSSRAEVRTSAADEDTDLLLRQTRESTAYINGHREDSLSAGDAAAVSRQTKRPDFNISVNINPFFTYNPWYGPWRYSYFDTWYNPWYSWYDPFFGSWNDPWYGPSWRWHAGWYYPHYGFAGSWYDPWYSPWYGSWYGAWYDPFFGPWHAGWYDPYMYGGWYGTVWGHGHTVYLRERSAYPRGSRGNYRADGMGSVSSVHRLRPVQAASGGTAAASSKTSLRPVRRTGGTVSSAAADRTSGNRVSGTAAGPERISSVNRRAASVQAGRPGASATDGTSGVSRTSSTRSYRPVTGSAGGAGTNIGNYVGNSGTDRSGNRNSTYRDNSSGSSYRSSASSVSRGSSGSSFSGGSSVSRSGGSSGARRR